MRLAITLQATGRDGERFATEYGDLGEAFTAATELLAMGAEVTLGTRRIRATQIGFGRVLTETRELAA